MKHLNQRLSSAAYGDKVDGGGGGKLSTFLAAILSSEQDTVLLQSQTDAVSHNCNCA